MPFNGLREFIDLLEKEGELAHVKVPVDLNQELGAVCVKSLKNYGPALLFEKPGGRDIPVVMNLLATRRRYALAMQCKQEEIHEEWNRRVSNPLPPMLVESGKCQQEVWLGDEANLNRLIAPILNARDGGPYLTLSCHITKDLTTGARNVAVYRNMVHDEHTLGLLSGPYTHIMLQHRTAPNEPFPVAIVMGADPRVVMAACSPFPFGTYRGCSSCGTKVACHLGEWAFAAVSSKHADDDLFHGSKDVGLGQPTNVLVCQRADGPAWRLVSRASRRIGRLRGAGNRGPEWRADQPRLKTRLRH